VRNPGENVAEKLINGPREFKPSETNNIPSRNIAESLGGIVMAEGQRASLSGNRLDELVYKIDARG